MLDVAFAVPGDIASPTGGYGYARKLVGLLPEHGVGVRLLGLASSFPHPSAADLDATGRLLSGLSARAVLLADGLAYGAFPAAIVAAIACPIVALVHHPLALESGLDPSRRTALVDLETAALAAARRIVVTSPATARLLAAEFGVPSERIIVAEPGVEPARRARGLGAPVRLLAVGAVSPRKAYDVLLEALTGLGDLDWRLTIAGSLERDRATARALRRRVETAALGDRVSLAGAVDPAALEGLYEGADICVSASRFEGYGMVLAEAMARGLPLVVARGGAAADTAAGAAALIVPPGDADALAQALRRLIGDPHLRRALSDQSWAAGQGLPRWSATAATVARVLKEAAA